jgi:hypothetical protein
MTLSIPSFYLVTFANYVRCTKFWKLFHSQEIAFLQLTSLIIPWIRGKHTFRQNLVKNSKNITQSCSTSSIHSYDTFIKKTFHKTKRIVGIFEEKITSNRDLSRHRKSINDYISMNLISAYSLSTNNTSLSRQSRSANVKISTVLFSKLILSLHSSLPIQPRRTKTTGISRKSASSTTFLMSQKCCSCSVRSFA